MNYTEKSLLTQYYSDLKNQRTNQKKNPTFSLQRKSS